MSKIRVFPVDDQASIRESMRAMLETDVDIEVVGEAADGEQALRELELRDADVVLMDIEMPGMNGLEATRLLKERSPDLAVVILTSHQGEFVTEARDAGAIGYLLKLANIQDLIQAVRNAHEASNRLQRDR